MVGYFDELAAAVQRDEVDEGTLAGIATWYGMEVLGPGPLSRPARVRWRRLGPRPW